MPAVAEAAIRTRHPGLPEDVRSSLARHYGLLALDLLAAADDDPGLLERLHPDAPEIWAQVVYARDHEWAATPDDVFRNRTTLALRGLAGGDVAARVERMLRAP